MKNFTDAMDRFQNIDGDNFGPCYTEGNFGHYYLETRVRKQDGKLCIIMYYPNRPSYEIFVQED